MVAKPFRSNYTQSIRCSLWSKPMTVMQNDSTSSKTLIGEAAHTFALIASFSSSREVTENENPRVVKKEWSRYFSNSFSYVCLACHLPMKPLITEICELFSLLIRSLDNIGKTLRISSSGRTKGSSRGGNEFTSHQDKRFLFPLCNL